MHLLCILSFSYSGRLNIRKNIKKNRKIKMNITLTAINSKFIHSNLALRYLKSYFLENAEEDVRERIKLSFVESTINDDLGDILEEIIASKPNVVVFSTYIWNFDEVRLLINNIKNIDEGIKIVCGGPEVSFESSRHIGLMDCDCIIRGEGEESFLELMTALTRGYDLKKIKGLTFRTDFSSLIHVKTSIINNESNNKDNNKFEIKGSDLDIIESEDREVLDINKIVFPYDEDVIKSLENRIVYYEASRGCPFGCSYCMSCLDRKVRYLSEERVKRELDFFMKMKVPLVKFVDRTFNTDKNFSYAIWKHIIDRRKENPDFITCFHFEVSGALITDEQIELLSESEKGLIQIEAGIQTTDKGILKNINRYDSFGKLKESIIKITEKDNVHVHVDLIAGLPGESYQGFKKSFNDCMELNAHMVQLGFLKVLKGTPIYSQLDLWGIKYSEKQPYEVLKTKFISYEELREIKKVEEVVEKFYNSGLYKYTFKMLMKEMKSKSQTERRLKDSYEFFLELSRILGRYKREIKPNLKKDDYLEVIILFNREWGLLNEDILNQLLKFDYIVNDRRGNIPEIIQNKDKSLKVTVCSFKNELVKLKGNINWFTISIWNLIIREVITIEDNYIFYSLTEKNIYKAVKNKDGNGEFQLTKIIF